MSFIFFSITVVMHCSTSFDISICKRSCSRRMPSSCSTSFDISTYKRSCSSRMPSSCSNRMSSCSSCYSFQWSYSGTSILACFTTKSCKSFSLAALIASISSLAFYNWRCRSEDCVIKIEEGASLIACLNSRIYLDFLHNISEYISIST